MRKIIIAPMFLICCLVPPPKIMAAPVAQQMEAWGQGVSEFEAVKAAYKKLFADALNVAREGGGSFEGATRRAFARDLEEDLPRIQSTYFPDAAPPDCREANEQFECRVVASVRMDELEAKLRMLSKNTVSAASDVTDWKIALSSAATGDAANDLTAWLRNKLEGDFGHDVYLAKQYVDADALRDQCTGYRTNADAYDARGDQFHQTALAYRNGYRTCKDLLDRDLIIILEDVKFRPQAFNTRNRRMAGEIRLRMKLLQVQSRSPLISPPPQTIKQYGHGDSAAMAQADLRDRLYQAAANYVAQQINPALMKAMENGGSKPSAAMREYLISVGGVPPDTEQGRTRLRLVRNWFSSKDGHVLTADVTQTNFGEQIYRFSSAQQPNWTTLVDSLYGVLDKAGEAARVEVDRSSNLSVVFQDKRAAGAKSSDVTMNLASSPVKRAITVEEHSLKTHRRDPQTGAAIAVKEAGLRIRNKSRKDLLLSVKPAWKDQDGSSLPAPYSYRQTIRLAAKTSERFVLRAPSKLAESVTIEIDCTGETCEIPQ